MDHAPTYTPPHRLTLYTRQHCPLCEDMAELLAEYRDELRFVVESRDIDTDPEWRARYHTEVPVLMLGEAEICRHFLDLAALKNALTDTAPGIAVE